MVWQGLIREHGRRCGGDMNLNLYIRQTELLKALGRTDTSTLARKWLTDKLHDLTKGTIELITTKQKFIGHLVNSVGESQIDTKIHFYSIELPGQLTPLLSDELAMIDLDRKLSFGRNQLACWLHDFISTQSNTREIFSTIKDLRSLSGSVLGLPQFRQNLKEAVKLLKASNDPLLIDAHISAADIFVYSKNPTKVVWINEEINRKHEARYQHEAAAQAARERRSRAAL